MPQTPSEDPWVSRYKRLLLDYLKEPADIDLSTVVIDPAYRDGQHATDDTMAEPYFQIKVHWLYPHMPPQYLDPDYRWKPTPNADGLYEYEREISDEEVQEFLRSLT